MWWQNMIFGLKKHLKTILTEITTEITEINLDYEIVKHTKVKKLVKWLKITQSKMLLDTAWFSATALNKFSYMLSTCWLFAHSCNCNCNREAFLVIVSWSWLWWCQHWTKHSSTSSQKLHWICTLTWQNSWRSTLTGRGGVIRKIRR